MDFIEKLFGIAPDGGNGMLETSLLVSAVVGVALVALLFYRRVRRLKR